MRNADLLSIFGRRKLGHPVLLGNTPFLHALNDRKKNKFDKINVFNDPIDSTHSINNVVYIRKCRDKLVLCQKFC